jgi:hypothetical protein
MPCSLLLATSQVRVTIYNSYIRTVSLSCMYVCMYVCMYACSALYTDDVQLLHGIFFI